MNFLGIYTDILACMAFYNVNWMMLILVIVDCVSKFFSNNADILYAVVELFNMMFQSGK